MAQQPEARAVAGAREVAVCVPDGCFLRVLAAGDDGVGGAGAGAGARAGGGAAGRAPPRAGEGWRQRAGVQQLPAGVLLTLHEGFHRASAVGDLDILRPPARAPAPPAVLRPEEAWLECARRDAHFPFVLAAYQHFVRAGWRVSSGLKYGATFLLYASDTPAPPREAGSEARGAQGGAPHGHAPFAVYVLPPRVLHKRGAGLLSPGTRKRRQGDDEAEAGSPQGGGDAGSAGSEADGAAASEDWTAIQSFTRLAAHVSKRFIIAYTSYTPASGGCAAAGEGDADPRGVDGGGRAEADWHASRKGGGRGIENLQDMQRIAIRELHLNRAL